MPGSITIRHATPADAAEIVGLVRESFLLDVALTIFGCHGIADYLRTELALPREFSASIYLVADLGSGLAGFIELRSSEYGLSLNYVATRSEYRGKGVARDLLAEALRIAGAPHGTEFTLDVFEHNETALQWYRRCGFTDRQRLAFCRVAAPERVNEGKVQITGLPQADAAQRSFGFSTFTLTHEFRTFTVGRLGERWFRLTDRRLLDNPTGLGVLQKLDPRREFLFHGVEEDASRAFSVPLLRTIRMGKCL